MNINLDICRQFNYMFHIVECIKRRVNKQTCGHKLLGVTLACENSFLHNNNVWLPLAVFFWGVGGGVVVFLSVLFPLIDGL